MKAFALPLILTGVILILIGLAFLLGDKIPFLGKLPGDISYKGGNSSFSFPITTCIIISIILTILANIILRFFRK